MNKQESVSEQRERLMLQQLLYAPPSKRSVFLLLSIRWPSLGDLRLQISHVFYAPSPRVVGAYIADHMEQFDVFDRTIVFRCGDNVSYFEQKDIFLELNHIGNSRHRHLSIEKLAELEGVDGMTLLQVFDRLIEQKYSVRRKSNKLRYSGK